MNYEIKHAISGTVLFTLETKSLKLCLEAAVKSGADLSGANLFGKNLSRADLTEANLTRADLFGANLSGADLFRANLSGANLTETNLSRADLTEANLSGANLTGANLSRADLTETNLTEANLSRANLSRADLTEANLTRADLFRANLSGADLTEVNLSRADLTGAESINKFRCTPLTILQDQPGKIRAYKLVNATNQGPYNGGIVYAQGKKHKVENADTDDSKQCAAGISLATLDWCIKEWQKGYKILIAEFTAKDIACIPIATDGKFRVHCCKIIGEKDLKEIGLIQK